jgi:hypothetical protein
MDAVACFESRVTATRQSPARREPRRGEQSSPLKCVPKRSIGTRARRYLELRPLASLNTCFEGEDDEEHENATETCFGSRFDSGLKTNNR